MSKYDKYRENFMKSVQESNSRPDKYTLEECELAPDDDTEFVKNYLKARRGEHDETSI